MINTGDLNYFVMHCLCLLGACFLLWGKRKEVDLGVKEGRQDLGEWREGKQWLGCVDYKNNLVSKQIKSSK